jgi:hypothetical protein
MTALSSLIRPEIMRAHRATWYVWAGSEKIRRTAQMRGAWGFDATCSCGQYETRTGGGTRTYVEELMWDHRFAAQSAAGRVADGRPVVAVTGHRAGEHGTQTTTDTPYCLVIFDGDTAETAYRTAELRKEGQS